MASVRIGEWDVDLSAGTASNGETEVRMVPRADGTYSLEYRHQEGSEPPDVSVLKILEAFEGGGVGLLEQGDGAAANAVYKNSAASYPEDEGCRTMFRLTPITEDDVARAMTEPEFKVFPKNPNELAALYNRILEDKLFEGLNPPAPPDRRRRGR